MSAPLPTFPDESRFRDSEINCFHDVEMTRGPFAQFFYVIWDVPEPPLTITTWVEHIWDPFFFFKMVLVFCPFFGLGVSEPRLGVSFPRLPKRLVFLGFTVCTLKYTHCRHMLVCYSYGGFIASPFCLS